MYLYGMEGSGLAFLYQKIWGGGGGLQERADHTSEYGTQIVIAAHAEMPF